MATYLIRYPKGDGDSIVAQDDPLTLTFDHGWAILTDPQGVCFAFSAGSGVVITRIDPPEDQPEE